MKNFRVKIKQLPTTIIKLISINYKYQNHLANNTNPQHYEKIKKIVNSFKFNKDFFKVFKNPTGNFHNGRNGFAIETFFLKYLYETNQFESLILNQSQIKRITNIPTDFVIDKIPYQLKTFELQNKNGIDERCLRFSLFSDSNFPTVKPIFEKQKDFFKKQIKLYNSKICNIIFLFFSRLYNLVILYYLPYENLKAINKLINKKGKYFNVELYKGLTVFFTYTKNNVSFFQQKPWNLRNFKKSFF